MITINRNEFRNRMIRKGFTATGLAKKAGISQSYITYILQGKRSILPPTAKKICDALDCGFDEIFKITEVRDDGASSTK